MSLLAVQLVEFYMESVERRDSAGNPIYEDREFVRITNPAGKDIVEREVKPEDKVTYIAQYQAFKDGIVYEGEGIKLKDTSFLSKSEIETCRAAKVFTVEQLANVDENGLKALGLNALALKQKAENWLKGRTSADSLVNQINTLERRLDEYDALKQEVLAKNQVIANKDAELAELKSKISELMSKPKNKG